MPDTFGCLASLGNYSAPNAQKTTIAPYRAYFEGTSIETLTGNGAKAAFSNIIKYVVNF